MLTCSSALSYLLSHTLSHSCTQSQFFNYILLLPFVFGRRRTSNTPRAHVSHVYLKLGSLHLAELRTKAEHPAFYVAGDVYWTRLSRRIRSTHARRQ
jgi:hypothetical protein